ncbi:hypothetical protein SBRCBS47491_002523 [Sporothrix bragantina]|uniref:Uncharacterized protein n=1 Tax=Sporothrix bragantina TaxID=671064 RepID=A0ABP0B7K9_9PEZI
MGTPLRQISEDAIHALAVVLSLPPDQLKRIGTHHRAKPAASWLSEQESRIPGLPNCLLIPQIPHLSVKVAQVAKRVIIAASGGADTLAAKAAVKGINVDAILHPCATPTVLCPAHRGLHPTVIREIFFYLSREVADHADFVRRHPCDENTSHTDKCSRQSRDVYDWGLRMIGISALWCTPHTFRALEKGRQTSVPGYRLPQRKAQPACSSAASSALPVPAPHIRVHMRLPHLEFPCEACVLAAVGARSQNLIDLRASLLSRMGLDGQEKVRRAKHKGEKCTSLSNDRPDRYPNLWALIESYVDVLGLEYGEKIAAEIRERSVNLAKLLLRARTCESRRQRHHARDVKRLRSAGKSTKKIAEKRPPRMVTNRGHRLPLPLVPLDHDLWAYYNESVVGENQQGPMDCEVSNGNPEDQDRLYFVVQDSQETIPQEEEEENEEQHEEELQENSMEGEPEEDLEYDAFVEEYQDEAPVAETSPIPDWEEDYIRDVLESQTVLSADYDRPPARCENYDDDDTSSYVTISVHTNVSSNIGSRDGLPTPSTTRSAVSSISGTSTATKASQSSSDSVTQRSTASSARSSAFSARSYASSTRSSQSGRTVRPTSAAPRSRSPSPPPSQVSSSPPPSSVYSQPVPASQASFKSSVSSALSRSRVSSTASTSTARPVPSTTSSRPSVARSTTSSVSRSRSSAVSASSATSSKASKVPSTAFVPSSSGRKASSAKSYVALQADLEASFLSENGSRNSSSSSATRSSTRSTTSSVVSRLTRSSTNTSVTSRPSHSQVPSQASSQAFSSSSPRATRTTKTANAPKSMTPSSTVTEMTTTQSELSRVLAMAKTAAYKAPSMAHSVSLAQPSAVPPPLVPSSNLDRTFASTSSSRASGSVSSSRSGSRTPSVSVSVSTSVSASGSASATSAHPRRSAPLSSPTPSTSPARETKWPAPPPPAPRSAPKQSPYTSKPLPALPASACRHNAKAAAWAESAPSTFSWSQPSPSVAPSFAGMVATQGARDTDCLVLPEDSISVVIAQQFMNTVDEEARKGMEKQEKKDKNVKETKKEKKTAPAPTRNLNHYQPANSRCPLQGPSASSSSAARPQTRRRGDEPVPVAPQRATPDRTASTRIRTTRVHPLRAPPMVSTTRAPPCAPPRHRPSGPSHSTSSDQLILPEARNSQSSRLTQWPSYSLMI